MNKYLKWGCLGAILFFGLVGWASMSNVPSNTDKSATQTTGNNTTGSNQPTAVPAEIVEPTVVDTAKFVEEFDKNQLAAEEKYKEQTVKFTAYIKNISEDIMGSPFLSLQPTNDQYYFGTTVKCTFEDKSELISLENGQKVTIIGKVNSQSLGIIGVEDCKIAE